MSAYPLWAHVGPAEFTEYHAFWWQSIWIPLFVPVGLTIVCLIAMLWHRPSRVPRWSVWTGIGLQALIYALTLIWWAPLMAALGTNQEEFQRVLHWGPLLPLLGVHSGTFQYDFHLLLTTHWLRVALISLYGLLILWMAIRTFVAEGESNF